MTNFENLIELANNGDAKAQYKLGIYYLDQEGNEEKAFKLIKESAEKGVAPAQVQLGCLYQYGEGVEKNNEEALKWFRLAAKQQNPSAYVFLGLHYKEGEHYEEALKYFLTAAKLGDPIAMILTAKCYTEGLGVEKNKEEADKWYGLAEKSGLKLIRPEENN